METSFQSTPTSQCGRPAGPRWWPGTIDNDGDTSASQEASGRRSPVAGTYAPPRSSTRTHAVGRRARTKRCDLRWLASCPQLGQLASPTPTCRRGARLPGADMPAGALTERVHHGKPTPSGQLIKCLGDGGKWWSDQLMTAHKLWSHL